MCVCGWVDRWVGVGGCVCVCKRDRETYTQTETERELFSDYYNFFLSFFFFFHEDFLLGHQCNTRMVS